MCDQSDGVSCCAGYNYQILMQANSRNLRDVQSVQLCDSITSIDSCFDFVAVGCLDDTVYIWPSDLKTIKKDPLHTRTGNAMGIVDLSFNKKSTHLATSCMDSTVRLYDLHTLEVTTVECQVMENWKVQFIDDNIVTAGDYGRVHFYDYTSKEKVKKLQLGEVFLTALTKSNDKPYLAAGNNNGDVYIVNSSSNKDLTVSLKPHHKLVRQLAFIDDDSKLLSASDDCSLRMIDIASEKVVQAFEGHKLAVSSVEPHQGDPRVFFSTSFDKTVKVWDLRTKTCVGGAVTGSALWDCRSVGKNLLAGGQNGLLIVYSVE